MCPSGTRRSSRRPRRPNDSRALAERIEDSLAFTSASGIDPVHAPQLRWAAVYTAHDALLPHEAALTRQDSLTGDWYACSAHLLWVGDRTRQADHAHVACLRGLANPLRMKCGPTLQPDDLLRVLAALNPANEPGRTTLITRMGADMLGADLPGADPCGAA